ncbi:hypothetical protein [Nicoliella lavandulae]|uniref:Uncharacterized protein n=1 Tax=Nicoliella lavandulae TaxID=3082954 RepID=A0ABU8SLS5_9LACO
MKLQLKMPVELANQINLNISESQGALNHEKMISIITEDEDHANDIACDILPELMTISPTAPMIII